VQSLPDRQRRSCADSAHSERAAFSGARAEIIHQPPSGDIAEATPPPGRGALLNFGTSRCNDWQNRRRLNERLNSSQLILCLAEAPKPGTLAHPKDPHVHVALR